MIKIEPKSKGRGRGLKHLKEIAKQTPRPPKAFLEETASVQNVHAKADGRKLYCCLFCNICLDL